MTHQMMTHPHTAAAAVMVGGGGKSVTATAAGTDPQESGTNLGITGVTQSTRDHRDRSDMHERTETGGKDTGTAGLTGAQQMGRVTAKVTGTGTRQADVTEAVLLEANFQSD